MKTHPPSPFTPAGPRISKALSVVHHVAHRLARHVAHRLGRARAILSRSGALCVATSLLAAGLVAGLGAGLTACEPKPISDLAAEDGISRIRSYHADKSWERVITEVNEYRSRYPYTQFAAEAELLQADAYFQAERFPEAVAAYEDFLRKNPSHPQADLAAFRIARSYDLQSPEEIDREQLNAIKAIERYGSFLERYGQSKYGGEARTRTDVLRRRIAEHFAFVARFYWKKDLFQGALSRYLIILDEYGMFDDLKQEARDRAAQSYRELADILEKDPKSDAVVYFRGQTPEALRKKAAEIEARRTGGK